MSSSKTTSWPLSFGTNGLPHSRHLVGTFIASLPRVYAGQCGKPHELTLVLYPVFIAVFTTTATGAEWCRPCQGKFTRYKAIVAAMSRYRMFVLHVLSLVERETSCVADSEATAHIGTVLGVYFGEATETGLHYKRPFFSDSSVSVHTKGAVLPVLRAKCALQIVLSELTNTTNYSP